MLLSLAFAIFAAPSALAYSVKPDGVKGITTKFQDGLHEQSVSSALAGEHDTMPGGGATSLGLVLPHWNAGLGAVISESYASTCKVLTSRCRSSCTASLKSRKDAASNGCWKWFVEEIKTGAKEPDNKSCPSTPSHADMIHQAVFSGYAAVNPLGICRTAIQVWHATPPPLVSVLDLKNTVIAPAERVAALSAALGPGVAVLPYPGVENVGVGHTTGRSSIR